MADKVVNVKLVLSAEGLAEAEATAAKLRANLKGAGEQAKGYQALMKPTGTSGTGESKQSRSLGPGAGTGSAASDFAAQASGLGGLVHLYATFAANLFAVSAGWSALSKAMDTTNLVAGLDQIGAASGRNLGSLAKQMVEVADGALSMQQAMQSTAMASAGGMTNSAILRMTQVAKQASLALGRDLPDSMDRLTKGIVKTQPELLDELGIMTRVIPAQQKYAEQVGKTIGSLTDFEKRQAFANAVLSEGESKFSAIALNANPFTKVLSSIQNLMQGGLELVNKVMGPLMNMLASSPTGLATALTGVAAILVKQAVPAIGMLRENSKRMAEESRSRLLRQIADQEYSAGQSDADAAAAAEAKYRASTKAQSLAAASGSTFDKKLVGQDVRDTLRKSPFEMTTADMAKIKSKQEELTAQAVAAEDSVHKVKLEREAQRLSAKLTNVNKLKTAEIQAGNEAVEVREAADAKSFSHVAMQQRIALKLQNQAATRAVLSTAADDAATMGPSYAFTKLRASVNELDVSKISKIGTTIRGTMTIATSAIGTAINAFSVWGQVAALVGVGLALLDGWLTKSAKEAEAYGTAIDTLNSSFSNVQRTLENISRKDPLEQISVDSTQAKANALNDLVDSLSDVIYTFDKLKAAQGGWDKFKNGFLDMFGSGDGDKLAKGLSTAVVEALSLLEEGPAKEAAKASLGKILTEATGSDVRLTSIDGIRDSIKDLDETKIAKIGKELKGVFDIANRDAGNAASSLSAFKVALADIAKQATVTTNKLIPTDDVSKMGVELGKAAKSLSDTVGNTSNYLTGLRELAKNTQALSFIDPMQANKLRANIQELETLQTRVITSQNELSASQSKVTDNKAILASDISQDKTVKARATLIIEQESRIVEAKNKSLSADKARLEEIKDLYKGIPDLLAKASFDNLTKGLQNAMAQANLSMRKGLVGIAQSAGANMEVQSTKLAVQELDMKAALIRQEVALIVSIEKLNATNERLVLETERTNIQQAIRGEMDKRGTANQPAIDILEKKLLSNAKSIEDADKKVAITTSSASGNIPKLTSEVFRLLPSLAAALTGAAASLSTLGAERVVRQTEQKIAEKNEGYKDAKSSNTQEMERLDSARKILEAVTSTNGYYDKALETKKVENTIAKEGLALVNKNLDTTMQLNALELGRAALVTSVGKKADTSQIDLAIDRAKTQLAVDTDNFNLQTKINLQGLEYRNTMSELATAYTNASHAQELLVISSTAEFEAQASLLSAKQAVMGLSELEIALNTRDATNKKADFAFEISALKIVIDLQDKLNKLKADPSKSKDTVESEVKLAGEAAGRDLAKAQAESAATKKGAEAVFDATNIDITAKMDWVGGAKEGLQSYLKEVGDVASKSKDLMTKSFQGMEDALVDFATTGKLDFASLANSIISDMVRIAVQQSITGPLAKAAMSMFFADGGTFDTGGVQKFAKGSGFTNSIVNTPTLFPFAQGTGLMGEAGPEAIMPLTRDSSGTLGVRSNGGGYSAPSNNVTINIVESSEKAGTQERKQENGTDMITVFVEKVKNAVASDITKGGGVIANAMSRTYGLNRAAGAY